MLKFLFGDPSDYAGSALYNSSTIIAAVIIRVSPVALLSAFCGGLWRKKKECGIIVIIAVYTKIQNGGRGGDD